MSFLLVLSLAQADDVRDLANQWRVHHNEALALLEADQPDQALEHARKSVDTAPERERRHALQVLAMSAAAAGDPIAEADALDSLMPYDNVPWGLYWNGTLDAMAAQMPASAYRYSQRTLQLTDQPGEFAPIAFQAALRVGRLDDAQATLQYFDSAASRSALAQAWAEQGACTQALALDPATACTAPVVAVAEPEPTGRRRRR